MTDPRRLCIAITKTKLTGFSISAPDKPTEDDGTAKKPTAMIHLDLMTEYGHKVTSVCYNNAYSWQKDQMFDIPERALELIQELAMIFHQVGEAKVQNVSALLATPPPLN